MDIEPAHQIRRGESRFAAVQALGRQIKRPVEWRPGDLLVYARHLKSWCVKNGDQVITSRALEILVARTKNIHRKALHGFGEESHRLHFRIDGLGKVGREGETKNKRAQIVERCYSAEIAG